MKTSNGCKVHFSVDDIGSCFRWLYQHDAKTLFQIPLFAQLKEFHEKYGLKCSLYIFEPTDFFWMASHFQHFRDDFSLNSTWLRFGYHGNKIRFSKDYAYASGYYLFECACQKLDAEITKTVRLHNWYATPEQKSFLYDKGVRTLLYPDDNCLRYDENGCFTEQGILHRKTNVRIENIAEITCSSLLIGKEKYIVAFTHEGCFDTQSSKIESAVKLYSECGYEYV